MNTDQIRHLTELLQSENFLGVQKEASELVKELQMQLKNSTVAAVTEESDDDTVEVDLAELASEGLTLDGNGEIRPLEPGEEVILPEPAEAEGPDPQIAEVEALIEQFHEKRKAISFERKSVFETNLASKEDLLKELENLIKAEENIGKAYSRMKEIHESWKNIGETPKDKGQDLQTRFSKLNEEFYYNINIYKELREFDLKKNQDKKEGLIAKLDELEKMTSIREMDEKLKKIQKIWDETGPTFQEKWPEMKERYWAKVRELHKKTREFYNERRKVQAENLEAKKALVVQTATLVETFPDNHKAWEAQTKEVLAVQEAWKGIGFAARADNEVVWKEFRGLCDSFFQAKKAFYDRRKDEFTEKRDAKVALIERADVLKDSDNWQEASHELINLQKEWKKIGYAGPRSDNKLWNQFRACCDHFFTRKQGEQESKDKALEVNLEAKEAFLKKVQAYTPAKDAEKAVAELQDLSKEFNAIGGVPRAESARIFKAFNAAMDAHYDALGLGEEKEKVLFSARLETMKSAPNADQMFEKEREQLRAQITEINNEIRQYENNLGFFGKSKGAQALMAEVQEKIDAHKAKVDGLKAMLKQIPK